MKLILTPSSRSVINPIFSIVLHMVSSIIEHKKISHKCALQHVYLIFFFQSALTCVVYIIVSPFALFIDVCVWFVSSDISTWARDFPVHWLSLPVGLRWWLPPLQCITYDYCIVLLFLFTLISSHSGSLATRMLNFRIGSVGLLHRYDGANVVGWVR